MFYFLEILFALLPSYALRFKIGPLPVNALEILCVLFFISFVIWLEIKKLRADFINFARRDSKKTVLVFILFFLAGTLSAYIGQSSRSYGLFAVLFFLPLLLFYPAKYLLANPLNKVRFVKWSLVVAGLYSLYALVQYFTLLGLPQMWQGNAVEPKRALSVFEYPNAFGLYLAPMLAFLLPFMFSKPSLHWFYKICYLLGAAGLLLSLSRGGWLGFGAALIVYLFAAADKSAKKYIFALLAIVTMAIIAVPNLRYRVYLPFVGEKSAVSRVSLWNTGWKMVKDSPILGKGLYGFKTNFDKFNTDPNLASINYPHNIFLNFWVETGLLGLLSFITICIARGYSAWKNKSLTNIGILLFLVAMFVHGMIDAPYLKNDLALLFWMIIAL